MSCRIKPKKLPEYVPDVGTVVSVILTNREARFLDKELCWFSNYRAKVVSIQQAEMSNAFLLQIDGLGEIVTINEEGEAKLYESDEKVLLAF